MMMMKRVWMNWLDKGMGNTNFGFKGEKQEFWWTECLMKTEPEYENFENKNWNKPGK